MVPQRIPNVPHQFARSTPLQACKLLASAAALLVLLLVGSGAVPVRSITVLLYVPVVALAVAVGVIAETALAGYRAVRAERPLRERVADRPLYAVVRAVESTLAFLAVGAVGSLPAVLPDGPMSGPGALGLFYGLLAVASVLLVGVLVRTGVEYGQYRPTGA